MNHKICDNGMPDRIVSHLPSLRASPPFHRYQVIHWWQRHTDV